MTYNKAACSIHTTTPLHRKRELHILSYDNFVDISNPIPKFPTDVQIQATNFQQMKEERLC